MAATHRRSVSWLSLSSVRRPTTAPTPPPARSDSIRPPAFKPFTTLSSAPSAQPQKPTWPPTAIGAAAPEQRAQTPQPPPVQRPLFRSATATAKPAAASPPPQPAAAPISLQPPARAAAQRSSPPPTLTITSPAVSNNAPKAPTTTSPALKSSQPIAPSIPTSPITTNPSSPSTILQQFNNSSAETTDHKSLLVQQVTEKSNQVDTKHHKLQSTAQIAKAGVAFEEKAVAMQRKHGMRIVRLVGNNIGAAMVVSGAKPLSIQDKRTVVLYSLTVTFKE
ncbi:PREDICTED: proline-rich receptor-like protein kinase PERK2 isoform X2 [Ipomoea nil]|uniref:proline-rich receptor-like protein kinase PERK2 isoform X2 n=1 Tax=Ipomoea nil TaxID=35883 RepID=UPI000901F6F6|nr:PREDICTED: proline-rich receptor-like protein kinase PERK2 isoform X2 [Ipomoea nil]